MLCSTLHIVCHLLVLGFGDSFSWFMASASCRILFIHLSTRSLLSAVSLAAFCSVTSSWMFSVKFSSWISYCCASVPVPYVCIFLTLALPSASCSCRPAPRCDPSASPSRYFARR